MGGWMASRGRLEGRSQGYGRLTIRSSALEGAMNEMSAQKRNQPGKLNIHTPSYLHRADILQ